LKDAFDRGVGQGREAKVLYKTCAMGHRAATGGLVPAEAGKLLHFIAQFIFSMHYLT
jgi:hypothetical protein